MTVSRRRRLRHGRSGCGLDEANITRFRDVLRELSLRTIYCHHHNRGHGAGSQYVVWHQHGGDGTSQVISMRMEDYVEDDDV